MTASSRPPGASTTSHRLIEGLAGACRIHALSAIDGTLTGTATATATAITKRRGTTAIVAATSAGSPTAARANSSRLVTQRPQCRGIPGAEFREDPLVERRGDQRDEHQIERDPKLDRERCAAR